MDTGLFPVLSYYEYGSYEHTYIDFLWKLFYFFWVTSREEFCTIG